MHHSLTHPITYSLIHTLTFSLNQSLVLDQLAAEEEELQRRIQQENNEILVKQAENIKKNATDILENTKLCLTDIKCLKDVLSIH